MTQTTDADFPILKIVAFVDSTTVVITGHRVDDLRMGDSLYVLAIGVTYVPEANIPLIVPKAAVEVTFAPGPYVLAQAPMVEKQTTGDLAASLAAMVGGTRTVKFRPALTTDEKSFIGNPANEPIKIGDVVVRARDVSNYIRYRFETKRP